MLGGGFIKSALAMTTAANGRRSRDARSPRALTQTQAEHGATWRAELDKAHDQQGVCALGAGL